MQNTTEYSLQQGQQITQGGGAGQGYSEETRGGRNPFVGSNRRAEPLAAFPSSQINVVSQQVSVGSYDYQPSQPAPPRAVELASQEGYTLTVARPPMPISSNNEILRPAGIMKPDSREAKIVRTQDGSKTKSVKIFGCQSPRFGAEQTMRPVTPSYLTSHIMVNGVPIQSRSKMLSARQNQVSFSPSFRSVRPGETNRPTTLVSVQSRFIPTAETAKNQWMLKHCKCCYNNYNCCCCSIDENSCCPCWQQMCNGCGHCCQCQICDCQSECWKGCFNWRTKCLATCLSCQYCKVCCYGDRFCTMQCCADSACLQRCCSYEGRCCDKICNKRCCSCCYDPAGECSTCRACCGDCSWLSNCLRGSCSNLEYCCQNNCTCLRPLCKRKCCQCKCCDCQCCDTGLCLWCKQKCCLMCL